MTTREELDAAIGRIKVKRRSEDAGRLMDIMQEVTGVEPVLWPGNIIGFGSYHYCYESGREGDTVKVGFAPRAAALTIYGLVQRYGKDTESFHNQELFDRLGAYSTGVGCLYVKYLDDIDTTVLKQLIAIGYQAD